MIDGKYKSTKSGISLRAIIDEIENVVGERNISSCKDIEDGMEEIDCERSRRAFHCLGNHELYCFSKAELSEIFRIPNWYSSYEFSPLDSRPSFAPWKFIILDSYDFSCLDVSTEEEAYAYLGDRNRNVVRGKDTGMRYLCENFQEHQRKI